MKNIFKIIVAMFMAIGILNADPLNQIGEKNGYEVSLTSVKSLIVGENKINIGLVKDGDVITDAKVKIKIFMPEMPGMPYMEFKNKAKLVDGVYKVVVNFSMSGTWQYHLKFKTKDGKIHTVRGSVNL
jgi:metal-sulfur cluster biosynthetic enzyme